MEHLMGLRADYDPYNVGSTALGVLIALILYNVVRSIPSAWRRFKAWRTTSGEEQLVRREEKERIARRLADKIEIAISDSVDEGDLSPEGGHKLRKMIGKKLGIKDLIPVGDVKKGIRLRMMRLYGKTPPKLPA